MRVDPNNFFIIPRHQYYHISHKIDGNFRLFQNHISYCDVVAVLMPDKTIMFLRNAETIGDKLREMGEYYSCFGEEPFYRFRYNAKDQLKLVKRKPNISINKWSLIINYDNKLINSLPCGIINSIMGVN